MRIVRWLFVLIVLLGIAAGIAYVIAGNADGPVITINQPQVIGQTGTLDVTIEAPDASLTALVIDVSQKTRTFPVLDLSSAPEGTIVREGTRLRITRPIGKSVAPELESGPATIRVSASRPVLFGVRQAASQATREVQVKLTPPRVSVASLHHYINLGGSEMVVYRVSPADAESGVRLGDHTYPGFPGSAAGLADPGLKVAFFALLYDQKPDPPIELFARDDAGNTARAQFDHRIFPKVFRNSKIPLDDRFLDRVVPAILQSSPQLKAPPEPLPAFLKINNDLRRMNNETIASMAAKTAPQILWEGAFQPLGGSQIESAFADFRTYLYGGKEVDRQVHLGFDLAKTVNAPVTAGNRGKVLFAEELGIYGNTVILDHGLGVQSLYAHLSSFGVKVGDDVQKGQTLGASGQTGLAGGDHLHFSMLVHGRFVNATEWWDPHWIEDRIMRKLREAGQPSP
jgi:murein DD-endopeptidase MepM/ murein hydrolase activator NlpD